MAKVVRPTAESHTSNCSYSEVKLLFLFVYEMVIFTNKPPIKRNDTDKINELRVAGKKLSSRLKELIRAANRAFLNHNQAPGQVCGRATEGWPEG